MRDKLTLIFCWVFLHCPTMEPLDICPTRKTSGYCWSTRVGRDLTRQRMLEKTLETRHGARCDRTVRESFLYHGSPKCFRRSPKPLGAGLGRVSQQYLMSQDSPPCMKIAGLFSVESLMWPSPPRWLWHQIDHHTGTVLAYGFGRRKDAVFLQRKALREPCGLTRFYTDH